MSEALRIGITGQNGFLGTCLTDYLRLQPGTVCVPCPREAWDEPERLEKFVTGCDVIVHFAGMSRSDDLQRLYQVNMALVDKLVAAMEAAKATPKILFASTTHEAKDTLYHASKRDGAAQLQRWAEQNGGKAVTLLLPNTFGPYMRPFFNSFVATFCYLAANGKEPENIADAEVELITSEAQCAGIWTAATTDCPERYTPPGTERHNVRNVWLTLCRFRQELFDNDRIPQLNNRFEAALFTAFTSYLD